MDPMAIRETARQHSADAGSEDERGGRDDRRDDRESAGASDAEAEQDDVAGHVRREHVAEAEVADGVDGPGRKGQRQQSQRQGMAEVRGGLLGEGRRWCD